MKTMVLLLISIAAALAGTSPNPDDIVARVATTDLMRQSSLGAYSWTSDYTLDNQERHAEMQVRWSRDADGTKHYEILYERGDGAVRRQVFRKLLATEVEASQPQTREHLRLDALNYSFRFAGLQDIQGRPAYIFEIEPRTSHKYLSEGRIWIDAEDYVVIRAEGSPCKRPSFWIKSVSFVQTYQKIDGFWFVASNRSVTDAKLFGIADLAIRNSDYRFGPVLLVSAK